MLAILPVSSSSFCLADVFGNGYSRKNPHIDYMLLFLFLMFNKIT